MAADLPVVYRKSGDISPSFTWFDWAAGAGYQVFYPIGADINGSSVYWLITKPIDGDTNNRYVTVTSGNTKRTFDVTFNAPVTIAAADAYTNYTHSLNTNSGGYVIVSISHVTSGGTETVLGTTTTDTRTTAGATEAVKRSVKVALTKKSFAVGEKLRLNLDVYRTAGTFTVFHDPTGRQTYTEAGTGVTIDTTSVLYIPFEIDL